MYIFLFLSGIGHGLSLYPGYIIIGQYFEKRRGAALGATCIGAGVGVLVSPPLLSYLFSTYGHRGGFIILAALTSHGFVSGALYRPIEQHLVMLRLDRGTNALSPKSNIRRNSTICDFSVFTNIRFIGYFMMMFGLYMAIAVITSLLPALVMEKGITRNDATLTLASIGGGEIVGSVLLGFLLDIAWIRRRMDYWFSACNLIIAVIMVIYPHMYTTSGFITLSVIQAGFTTHLVSQRITALSGIVLTEQINPALGLALCGNAAGALIGRGSGGKYTSGLILGLRPANERRCYFVTTSLIGWAQT